MGTDMDQNSIAQLLTDCLRNQLIEGYTQLPEGVALWRAGTRRKMSKEQAHAYLASLSAGKTPTFEPAATAPRKRKA
ncbi:MAG TPA: hypothetical protein VF190_10010 [Rhodothermales bacterium]